MKKKSVIVLSSLFCILVFVSATREIMPGCDAPLVGGHTGAPGETACNGCHAGTLNTGPATFTFDIGTTNYSAGQTYIGTVRISQSSMQKFGFSGLALKDSNNTTIGAFSLIDAVRTRTYTDGPRNYVSHTPCGADSSNANSWIFKWTAPPTNVGNITLYVGLLAANHSHSTSGDFSYALTKQITYQSVLGLNEEKIDFEIDVYPNPATHNLNVAIKNAGGSRSYHVSIYDMNGKRVYATETHHEFFKVNITTWEKGIYFFHLKDEFKTITKKIVIQ